MALLIVGGGLGAREWRSIAGSRAACASIESYRAQSGPVQQIGNGSPITVLGDSYSTGDELADRSNAWTHQFAVEQGRELDVVAEGGTGFTTAGYCGDGSYADRAHVAAGIGNSTVIVEGGLNDTGSPDQVASSARKVIAKFDGTVFLVGPVDAPAVAGESEVDQGLRQAAKQEGATYISALGWDDLSFGPDGKHLNPAGHRAYANHIASALS